MAQDRSPVLWAAGRPGDAAHAHWVREGVLSGLVAPLSEDGLSDVVGSWVGSGPNRAVGGGQLAALGPVKVQALAGQAGLPVESFLPMLAGALPAVVDAITPDGKVSGGGAAAGIDIGGLLEGLSSAAKAGPSSALCAPEAHGHSGRAGGTNGSRPAHDAGVWSGCIGRPRVPQVSLFGARQGGRR